MVQRVFVSKDWGSTAIWLPTDEGHWCNASHDSIDMPAELRARFDFFCAWHDHYMPGMGATEEPDNELIEAYMFSLAVDLKRHLGTAADVFIYKDGGHQAVELPPNNSSKPTPLRGAA